MGGVTVMSVHYRHTPVHVNMVNKKKKAEQAAVRKQEKAAKQNSKAAKKKLKEAGVEGEESVEAIIASLDKEDAKQQKEAAKSGKTTVGFLEPCRSPPSPRAACSLTLLPSGEVLLFGGEFFDGQNAKVFRDLYRWNVEKDEWRKVVFPSGTGPKPRCSHQAVLYKDTVIIFGGEFSTASQFHHFRDLWSFNLKTNTWTELVATGIGPSARSGHRMVLWRSYLVLFGGFHDSFRESRYFNDLFILDLHDLKWRKVALPPHANCPAPRSGCQFLVQSSSDSIFMFGGYSKVKDTGRAAEGKTWSDMWMLDMKPVVSNTKDGCPVWNRINKRGPLQPSARSSGTMVLHKNMAVMFGGVYDEDDKGSNLRSMFYNDMYAFDIDSRRWYQMGLKKGGGGQGKKGKKRNQAAAGKGSIKVMDEAGSAGQEDKDKDDDDGARRVDLDGQDEDLWNADDSDVEERTFGYIDCDGKLVRMLLTEFQTLPEGGGEEDEADDDDDIKDGDEKEARTASPPCEMARVAGEADNVTSPNGSEKSTAATEDSACRESGAVVVQGSERQASAAGENVGEPCADGEGAEKEKTRRTHEEQKKGGRGQTTTAAAENVDPSPSSSSRPLPAPVIAARENGEKSADPAKLFPDESTPLPRINACLFMKGTTLHVYGGVVEVGKKTLTLDDCWKLNLNIRDKWECLQRGTIDDHPWLELDSSDEDEEDSSSSSSDGDDEGSSSSSSSDGSHEADSSSDEDEENAAQADGKEVRRRRRRQKEEGTAERGNEGSQAPELEDVTATGTKEMEASKATTKQKNKKKSKKRNAKRAINDDDDEEEEEQVAIRERMKVVRQQLEEQGGGDLEAPRLGESLREFFDRTKSHWLGQAADRDLASQTQEGMKASKEASKVAFQLAQEKFEKLKPLLDAFRELEEEQKQLEDQNE